MALLLRRSLISFPPEQLLVSGALLFYSTSSNANNSITLNSVSEHLIHQHDFSPQAALDFSSYKPLLKQPEKVYSLITLLKDSGFSQFQLEKAIRKSPNLLSLDADIVQPKIKIFLDLGLEPSNIAKILSADPLILRRRTEQLLLNISILKGVLGSYANISDVVLKYSGGCGWFLKNNLDKIMVPNIELLKECGVSSKQIARYVALYPRFLVNKPERIQEFIETVDRMGVPRLTGRYMSAIRTRSSMSSESWGLKLEFLRNLGLSENDIFCMFRSLPQVLAVSKRKLRNVLNIMVGVGKVDLSHLVSHPEIFLYSIDKRLKPRVEVYQLLESKNLLKNKKMKLTTFCKLTNLEFLKFVSQFEDELGDEFAAIKRLNGS